MTDSDAKLAALARAVDMLANALTDVREQIAQAMGSPAPSNDDDDDELREMAAATAAQLRRRRAGKGR